MSDLNNHITDRRKQTRSAVFRYLHKASSPRSKLDIARDLELSMPTVYQNVSELLDAGFIEYCGMGESSGGRPPMYLQTVNDVCCAIGMNIKAETLDIASANLSGRETAFRSIPYSMAVESPEFAAFAVSELERFIDEKKLPRERLLGVGITLGGLIQAYTNNVIIAPTLAAKNMNLDLLVNSIPYPAILENDANSGGFAEWYSSGRQGKMAYLFLAEGIGGTMFVNDDEFTGTNGRSGEFGHMCVERGGKLCNCGKHGCLEAYCSSRRFRKELGMSTGEFFTALADGEPEALAIWEDYSSHLVTGIHNIRMVLDCDVVLGGHQSKYLEPYLPELKRKLAEGDPFDSSADYIRIAKDPEYSSILGVALYFIRDFISSI